MDTEKVASRDDPKEVHRQKMCDKWRVVWWLEIVQAPEDLVPKVRLHSMPTYFSRWAVRAFPQIGQRVCEINRLCRTIDLRSTFLRMPAVGQTRLPSID
jgi:hypothetical protein